MPSLKTGGTPVVEPATEPVDADATEANLDDEAKVMAFVRCMPDEGIEFRDPVVDSDGSVQRPDFVEVFSATRKEMAEPNAACTHHVEGLTLGRERQDLAERVDQFVELATCLREKGYDAHDPTAETLDQWGAGLRVEFDWDDPEARKTYQECSSSD